MIPPGLPLTPDPGELDAIFEVPLAHFLEDRRHHTDVIPVDGRPLYVPNYHVDGQVIWGLSAMMLVELLAEGFDRPISLTREPPGRLCYFPERLLRIQQRRSEEHTSELQSRPHLVCRLL